MPRTILKTGVLSCLLLGGLAQATELLYQPMPKDTVPTLSQPGRYAVGVQTKSIELPNSLQVNSGQAYSRPLTLELWYPATIGSAKPAQYQNQTRSGKAFSIQGNAWRDASPAADTGKLPVVVLSHGYTGYRSLMFYLGEHLASHGYIVAGIDHTDSTNAEVDFAKAPFAGFFSTLYHRSRDQQATLNYLMSAQSPLFAMTQPHNAGLVGYSMGGFGALSTLGACYQFNEAAIKQLTGSTQAEQIATIGNMLNSCNAGQTQVDPSWRAGVLLAPWGGQLQLFAPKSLAQIKTPLLYIAGDQDDISGYQGIKGLFKQTGSSERYLLTYHGARHNIAAHPAPLAARDNEGDFGHYAEPTWDIQRINLVNQHFILAMLNCQLKQLPDACNFLQLGNSRSDENKGWSGFAARYNTGMSWQQGSVSQAGSSLQSDSGTANARDN
jgi:predicted dienelactone hydrolase